MIFVVQDPVYLQKTASEAENFTIQGNFITGSPL